MQIATNKTTKALIINALKNENRLLEYSHKLIKNMQYKSNMELQEQKLTIQLVQKTKVAANSTLPAKLITIINKLLKGETLPAGFENMSVEAIKASFVPDRGGKQTIKAAKSKGGKKVALKGGEDIVVPKNIKSLSKEDLIGDVIKNFTKVKSISLNSLDTNITKFNTDELRAIDTALKMLVF